MDLKGINWFGQMYRKCETMLLEVEDDMHQIQDVVNYVENQMQTVGDSVKKFYSDVIQDLLPPSSAYVSTAGDSDMPVETYADACAYENTKAGTEEVHVNVDAESVMPNLKAIKVEVENHASSYHELNSVNSPSTSSLADSLNGSCSELCSTLYADGITPVKEEGSGRASEIFPPVHENHEASRGKMAISVSGCDGIENVSKHESDVSVDFPSSDESMSLRSIVNKVTELRLSSCGILPAESNAAYTSQSHEMVPMVISTTNGDEPCSDVTDKQAILSNSGKEDESNKHEINTKNVIELDLKTIQQFNHLKLEESCVVVNGDELNRVPLSKGKSRAYKEKIWDALSLRMKSSSRKEEYKQLALLYADNARSYHQFVQILMPDITMEDTRSLPTHDTGESEWELL